MEFKKISRENGLWAQLWGEWDEICLLYDESFQDYAPSSMTVLRPLAEDPETASAGVYGLIDSNKIIAVCQLNATLLPRYEGRVLRLRHLLLSPSFDFSDDINIEQYIEILSEMFTGTINCANNEMPAKHVKLHLQSPADRQFFKEIEQHLEKSAKFSSVKMQGAWLYITL